VRLLSQLHNADLVRADLPADIAELDERRGKQARAIMQQNLMGPLSFRVPLFDPWPLLGVTLPLVRPLVSAGAGALAGADGLGRAWRAGRCARHRCRRVRSGLDGVQHRHRHGHLCVDEGGARAWPRLGRATLRGRGARNGRDVSGLYSRSLCRGVRGCGPAVALAARSRQRGGYHRRDDVCRPRVSGLARYGARPCPRGGVQYHADRQPVDGAGQRQPAFEIRRLFRVH